jgi:hypothetical protein
MATGPRYSKAARAVAAKSGQALPNGSYPIRNKRELMAAVRRRRQGNAPYPQIVAHIRRRAKEMGVKLNMTADGKPQGTVVLTTSASVFGCYGKAKKKKKPGMM